MRPMKKRLKSLAACLIALAVLVLQAGCWSSHSINSLAFITLLGIDKEENGQYRLNVLVSLPKGGSESSSGGPTKKKSILLTAQSPSLLEGMRKIQTSLSKKTYWAHNLALVIGEQAARGNVAELLDMIIRQYDFRLQTPLMVVRGTAEDLFKTHPLLQDSLGAELEGLALSNEFASSTSVQDVAKFLYGYSSGVIDPMTALLNRHSAEGVTLIDKPDSPLLGLSGAAVFKGGKLAGFLDETATRGVLWVQGRVNKGAIRFACPNDKAGQVNAQFTTESSTLTPVLRGGEPEIDVKIAVVTEISEITCPSLKLDPDRIDEFRKEIEAKVKEEVAQALQQVQLKWGADPFGFGQAIWRRYPDVWRKLAPTWHDGGLKELKVNVTVRALNRRSGLINDTTGEVR